MSVMSKMSRASTRSSSTFSTSTMATITGLQRVALGNGKRSVVLERYSSWKEGEALPNHFTVFEDGHNNLNPSDLPPDLQAKLFSHDSLFASLSERGSTGEHPPATSGDSATDAPVPAIIINVDAISHPREGPEGAVVGLSSNMRLFMDNYEPTGHAGEPHAFEPNREEQPRPAHNEIDDRINQFISNASEKLTLVIKDGDSTALFGDLMQIFAHPKMWDAAFQFARDVHGKPGHRYDICWELIPRTTSSFMLSAVVDGTTMFFAGFGPAGDGRVATFSVKRRPGLKSMARTYDKSRIMLHEIDPTGLPGTIDPQYCVMSVKLLNRTRHVERFTLRPSARKVTANAKRLGRGHYVRITPHFKEVNDDEVKPAPPFSRGSTARVADADDEKDWTDEQVTVARPSSRSVSGSAKVKKELVKAPEPTRSIASLIADGTRVAFDINRNPILRCGRDYFRSIDAAQQASDRAFLASLEEEHGIATSSSKSASTVTPPVSDKSSSSIPSSASFHTSDDSSPPPPPPAGGARQAYESSVSDATHVPSTRETPSSGNLPARPGPSRFSTRLPSTHNRSTSATFPIGRGPSARSDRYNHSELSDDEWHYIYGHPQFQRKPYVAPEYPSIPSTPRVRAPRPLPRPPSSATRSSQVDDDKQPPYLPYNIPPSNVRRSARPQTPFTSQAEQDKAMQEVFEEAGHDADRLVRMLGPRLDDGRVNEGRREPTLLRDHDTRAFQPERRFNAPPPPPMRPRSSSSPSKVVVPSPAAAADTARPTAGGSRPAPLFKPVAPAVVSNAKVDKGKGKAKDDASSVKSSSSSKKSSKSKRSRRSKKSSKSSKSKENEKKDKGKGKAPAPPVTPPQSHKDKGKGKAPAPAPTPPRSPATPARTPGPATPARARGYATSGNTVAITETIKDGWPDVLEPADMAERQAQWLGEIDSHRVEDPPANPHPRRIVVNLRPQPTPVHTRSQRVADWVTQLERACLEDPLRSSNGEAVRRTVDAEYLEDEEDMDVATQMALWRSRYDQ